MVCLRLTMTTTTTDPSCVHKPKCWGLPVAPTAIVKSPQGGYSSSPDPVWPSALSEERQAVTPTLPARSRRRRRREKERSAHLIRACFANSLLLLRSPPSLGSALLATQSVVEQLCPVEQAHVRQAQADAHRGEVRSVHTSGGCK